MTKGTFARLSDRAVIEIRGEGAAAFLAGLATVDLSHLSPATPRHGALLTPQGKILFDFGIHAGGDDSVLLDVAAEARDELVKRLMFYRLRLKLDIAGRDDLAVFAAWGDDANGALPADPRHGGLGLRGIGRLDATPHELAPGSAEGSLGAYHAHRIDCGVAEAFRDFPGSDVFPHEANLDELHGVDFDKGCYVGQEVVSRMHHRGTAKKRFLVVEGEAELPPMGSEIRDGETLLGTMVSSVGRAGLALMRLDRTADAITAGRTIAAEGTTLQPRVPDWMSFSLTHTPSEKPA